MGAKECIDLAYRLISAEGVRSGIVATCQAGSKDWLQMSSQKCFNVVLVNRKQCISDYCRSD